MTRLQGVRPMIDVKDVAATVAWYTEVLGFELTNSMGDEGGELFWASFTRDGVSMMCNKLHTHDDGESVEDHGHEHPSEPVFTGSLYVNVDEVDELALDLGGRTGLLFGPVDQPHGMREIGVLDPDGYVLIFGMPIEG